MTFLKNLMGWLSAGSTNEYSVEVSNPDPGCGDSCLINPATNMPMINGTSVDVGGSPYGVDIHHSIDSDPIGNSLSIDSHHSFDTDLFSTHSSMDWPSQSMWDDPFAS